MGGRVKRDRGREKGKSNIEKFASLLRGGINGIKIAILSRVLRK